MTKMKPTEPICGIGTCRHLDCKDHIVIYIYLHEYKLTLWQYGQTQAQKISGGQRC
jgi:hypothetical protein